MPEGGTITIAGARGEAPAAFIRLSVTDTGVGMDETTLARATEPFFTTKGTGKGTGLGLSMVHGLAEQSGGGFALRSRKGEGTTAEIWLPLATAQVVDEPAAAAAEPAPQVAPVRGLAVLVVDDDPLVLANTAAMLEDLGHTALQAASGAEALGMLRGAHAVDVVLTDQVMPKMTGAQLIAAVKTEWPQLPLIIATGFAELPPTSTRTCRSSRNRSSKSCLPERSRPACREPPTIRRSWRSANGAVDTPGTLRGGQSRHSIAWAMAKMRPSPMRWAVKPFGKSGRNAASQALRPPA